MTFRGARVLVTGGTGFIGSRLTRRLHDQGADVHLLARRSSRPGRLGDVWERLRRHEGDLSDASSLAACVSAAAPAYVFHLAKDREGASFEREAAATLRLAEALRAKAPALKRWVRTAHAAAGRFGRGGDRHLAGLLQERFSLPAVTLELFLVYGPGQPPEDPPQSMISGAASASPAALESGGKDFVHVDDVVEAYLLAAARPGVEGRTIPIGSGRLTPWPALENLVRRLRGDGRRVDSPKPAPRGSAHRGWSAGLSQGHPAETGLARELLGWEPRIGLEQGLEALVAEAATGRRA